MTSRQPSRWFQAGFLALGLLLLALWSKSAIESNAFQSGESTNLEAALRAADSGPPEAMSEASLAAAVVGGPSPPRMGPGVLGRMEIPRLRISAIVAEGVDPKTLGRAVGHVVWTARPGGPGNCALAGHRDTFLRGLKEVRPNDVVRLVTPERTYTYEVAWSAVVEPRRVDLLDSTATRSLTLVTCYPFEFIGHAPQRFVVRATQIEPQLSHQLTHGRGATNGGSDHD